MKAESPKRSEWLPSVRTYEWEKEAVVEACNLSGVKMSEYIRQVVVNESLRRVKQG